MTDSDLVRMHVKDRMTLSAIGARVGLTRERIRQRVRRAGVPPRVTQVVRQENERAKRRRFVCQRCGVMSAPTNPYDAGRRKYCSRRCASTDRTRYTEAGLLRHLATLATELGHTPTMVDINNADGPSHVTYVNRFGSLSAAQRAAGLSPNKRGGYRCAKPLPENF